LVEELVSWGGEGRNPTGKVGFGGGACLVGRGGEGAGRTREGELAPRHLAEIRPARDYEGDSEAVAV
jgi:hypothetical protein